MLYLANQVGGRRLTGYVSDAIRRADQEEAEEVMSRLDEYRLGLELISLNDLDFAQNSYKIIVRYTI